jgi:hypothetical protein
MRVSALSEPPADARNRTYFHSHTQYAPVAQLDRALVSGTKGRGFESLRVYHA